MIRKKLNQIWWNNPQLKEIGLTYMRANGKTRRESFRYNQNNWDYHHDAVRIYAEMIQIIICQLLARLTIVHIFILPILQSAYGFIVWNWFDITVAPIRGAKNREQISRTTTLTCGMHTHARARAAKPKGCSNTPKKKSAVIGPRVRWMRSALRRCTPRSVVHYLQRVVARRAICNGCFMPH